MAIYFSMLSADVKQKITATSAIIQSEANKPVKTIAWHEATAELTRLKLSDELNVNSGVWRMIGGQMSDVADGWVFKLPVKVSL